MVYCAPHICSFPASKGAAVDLQASSGIYLCQHVRVEAIFLFETVDLCAWCATFPPRPLFEELAAKLILAYKNILNASSEG